MLDLKVVDENIGGFAVPSPLYAYRSWEPAAESSPTSLDAWGFEDRKPWVFPGGGHYELPGSMSTATAGSAAVTVPSSTVNTIAGARSTTPMATTQMANVVASPLSTTHPADARERSIRRCHSSAAILATPAAKRQPTVVVTTTARSPPRYRVCREAAGSASVSPLAPSGRILRQPSISPVERTTATTSPLRPPRSHTPQRARSGCSLSFGTGSPPGSSTSVAAAAPVWTATLADSAPVASAAMYQSERSARYNVPRTRYTTRPTTVSAMVPPISMRGDHAASSQFMTRYEHGMHHTAF